MGIEVGSVVYSKAGRDKDNCYVVIACESNNYFLVVDGKARTLVKPKRKNLRHLKSKGAVLTAIAEKLNAGKQVFDSEIRSALRAHIEV
ncbi:MAG: RNA-binding protein [Clostridia bacterium]|nr:RNA-binding protein [Clostridia bacterium]